MLSAILSFLGILPQAFTAINSITSAIANEKIAGIKAATQEEQIASAERVATLQAQRDVLVADSQKSNVDLYVRTLIASGPAFILCKIFFYDLIFDGTTNIPSTSPLWYVIMSVTGFYFLHATFGK